MGITPPHIFIPSGSVSVGVETDEVGHARIGFWLNRNANDLLSTRFVIRLHCYVALFLDCEIEMLLDTSLLY